MSQAPKLTYFDSCLRFKDKRFHAFLLKNSVLLQGMVGALALALAVLARQWLEASMWRHMVLQFPLLLLAGAAWAGALPPGLARAQHQPVRHHRLGGGQQRAWPC